VQSVQVPAVAADALHHGRPPLLAAQAVLPRGHVHARGQALEIPLPRSDRHLVEIIQVENDVTLRGAKQTEIVEMGVAIDDDVQAGGRST